MHEHVCVRAYACRLCACVRVGREVCVPYVRHIVVHEYLCYGQAHEHAPWHQIPSRQPTYWGI